MSLQFTDQVRADYTKLFATCAIRPEHVGDVARDANAITKNTGRYETVAGRLGMPWYFVGIVHCMEASLNFSLHLHNGDPLTHQTVHVPAGRPLGHPPFTWEDSAVDALQMRHLDKVTDWTLPSLLYHLEGYNGFGYRNQDPAINTPYLWSFSNNYTSGKFVADGKYDPATISKQCGAASLLLQMDQQGVIVLS